MNACFRGFALYTVLAVVGAGLAAKTPLSKAYHDRRTGLVVHFPATWRIDPDAQCFTIVSFPPERRPRMVLVPLNEAEIEVMAPPNDVRSLAGWMRAERIQENMNTRVTETAVNTLHYGRITTTRVREQLNVFGEGRSDAYFINFHDRLYKVRVFYRGLKRADYFEHVLLDIIRNLAPDTSTLP